MTPEAARQIVLARYPDAQTLRSNGCVVLITAEKRLCDWKRRPGEAWIATARRIEREPVERTQ